MDVFDYDINMHYSNIKENKLLYRRMGDGAASMTLRLRMGIALGKNIKLWLRIGMEMGLGMGLEVGYGRGWMY